MAAKAQEFRDRGGELYVRTSADAALEVSASAEPALQPQGD
jgi:hypothetical protein